ncbi:MAG: DMT family transporter [Neomegalonema sp.]|nr:DMT family transporter [Neomegalonema sp.]
MLALLRRLLNWIYSSPALLLIATAFFWGCNTIFGQLAKGEVGPFMIVMLRWVIVAMIMWPLGGAEVRAHWRELRPILPRLAILSGLGFTLFNLLMYVAAYGTTAVNIGIIQGAGPVVVLIGAYLAFGERPRLIQVAGVAATLVGVATVATKGEPLAIFSAALNWGDPIMLLAVALYSIYTLGMAKRPPLSGHAVFTLLAVIAASLAIPVGLFGLFVMGETAPTAKGWLIVLGVSLFPSLLAQITFLRGIDLVGPSRAIIYINFVPVFGAILAVLTLGERFELYHAIALALVMLGVFGAQQKAIQKISKTATETQRAR